MGTRVALQTERPGLVIGRKGQTIKTLTTAIEEQFGFENPSIEVTEVADLTINSSEIVGREVTISCNTYTWVEGTGDDAVTHADTVIDYIESTETSA